MEAWRWISRNLKIIDKAGQLVKLIPNVGQLMLDKTIEQQRAAGNPVRIILLKPRQVGWSTWSEGRAFHEINTMENRSALVVSADTDSTNLVFNMAKTFQDEMSGEVRRKTKASNKREIVYRAPWRSKIATQTSGKDVLGRGGTVHFLHASEVAFWQNAKEGLAAVLQQVPNNADTTVILETTANGVGGAFYDIFWKSVKRLQANPDDLGGYLPVFFPWYKFPEYKLDCRALTDLDEEERGLQEAGLSTSQLFWRRMKIEELGGDIALFKQEYPATAREAFQASGRSVFAQGILDAMEKQCLRGRTVRFHPGKPRFEPTEDKVNCWKLWHLPKPDHEYAMGVDTAQEKALDTEAKRSEPDFTAAVVVDRFSGEVVAQWHGRAGGREIAEQVLSCGLFYNNAWIAPELPFGMVVLDILRSRGYENIYSRTTHDETLIMEDGENLGWKTTTMTRPWMVDGLKDMVRDRSIHIHSRDIIDEMRTFVYEKNGKPVHMPGEHDDLIFALMIAIQIHLRCPIKPMPYSYAYSGNMEKSTTNDLSRSGAFDNWEPGEEYEQEHTE